MFLISDLVQRSEMNTFYNLQLKYWFVRLGIMYYADNLLSNKENKSTLSYEM